MVITVASESPCFICKYFLFPVKKFPLIGLMDFLLLFCSFEWWSFEILVLLSGLLPNPELESSVLSIW